MRRWNAIGRCVVLEVAVVALIAAVSADRVCGQAPAVGMNGALRVEGGRILNRRGETVVLRGMSLSPTAAKPEFYNANCVGWLQEDWNCSVVRAVMTVEPDGYLADPEREKARVKAVVQAAVNAGMYVIVAWHDDNAPQHVEQARAFFYEMAQTYGQQAAVLYEPWSEPPAGYDWSAQIKPFHEAVIAAIRARDGNNLIICGTPNRSRDVAAVAADPITGDNIAYALHFDARRDGQTLREEVSAALERGVALLATEWAAGSSEQTEAWIEFANGKNIGWCNASVTDVPDVSAALRPGADPNGGWPAEAISATGWLVRQELRKYRDPDILYVPTPMVVVDKMLELAQVKPTDLVYDLGCGDGRIVVEAAKRYGCRAVGYDIDPVRVQEARENVDANDLGDLVRIEHQDVFTLDLSDANVITLYLLPSLNVKLIPQLEQLRPGSRIVSHDFDMRGVIPDQVVRLEGHSVYLWTTPLKKEGSQGN